MITVYSKGVTIKPRADGKAREVDADGFALTYLDETKHDPFEVCNAAARSVGLVVNGGDDPKFSKVMAERAQRNRITSRSR